MIVKSSFEKIDGEIHGVLIDVQEETCFKGMGVRVGKAKVVFKDLDVFKELVNSQYPESKSPFFDVISYKDENDLKQEFDWEAVQKDTLSKIMEHQIRAINEVVTVHNGRCLVALPPGTGKTLIGCLCIAHYITTNALVCCPASKVADWKSEIKQWIGRDNVKVCSFDCLSRDEESKSTKWDVIIVDESHNLKNDCARTVSLKQMMLNAKALILLSGTPQESAPSELYNQLNLIRPDLFHKRETFVERYMEVKVDSAGNQQSSGAKNLDELAVLLERFMFRTSDAKAVDVNLERFIVHFEPTAEQIDEMQRFHLNHEDTIRRSGKNREDILRKRYALDTWKMAGRFKSDSITDWLGDLVRKTHKDEKVAVYVCHLDVADKLHAYLSTIDETVLITGKVSAKKRDNMIKGLAQKKGGPRFGVLTMNSVGDGINLVPGVSVVVLAELHMTPSKMEQVEKRAHRKGAERNVTTYWCILDKSSDRTRLNRLQQKKKINGTVLDFNKRSKISFS